MNNDQKICLEKLIYALQACEGHGLTFSPTHLRLDVEDEASHYLEYLSSQELFELLGSIE